MAHIKGGIGIPVSGVSLPEEAQAACLTLGLRAGVGVDEAFQVMVCGSFGLSLTNKGGMQVPGMVSAQGVLDFGA